LLLLLLLLAVAFVERAPPPVDMAAESAIELS